MSQHDLTIDNQGFPAFRADLNNALQALGSTQSGTSAPSPTFANQLWYDTTNNQLKIRNEDNDAWITLLTLDQSADSVSQLATAIAVLSAGTAGAPALTTSGDTNTGIFFPAADTIAFAEGGAEAMRIDSSGNVGINNTSPTRKIDVAGTMGITDTITSSKAVQAFLSNPTTGTDGSYWQHQNTGGSFFIGQENSAGGLITGSAYAKFVWGTGAYPLIFGTNNAERLRIPADAAGIQFPATQVASSNANTLDDYEEGTWTPVLSRDATAPSISYVTREGKYTKIGNMVTCWISINTITVSSAGSGANIITGLPFAIGNATYGGMGGFGYNDAFTNTVYGVVTVGGLTQVYFRGGARSSGNDAGGWSNSGYLGLTFTYFTS